MCVCVCVCVHVHVCVSACDSFSIYLMIVLIGTICVMWKNTSPSLFLALLFSPHRLSPDQQTGKVTQHIQFDAYDVNEFEYKLNM